jgi:hypothetical protein
MFKIWIAMVVLIAGILAIGFNSYRIMELNAAKVFNEQQLFLVREAARGIREFIGNIEGTLRFSADIIASSPQGAQSAEKVFRSVFANSARQMAYLFIADSDGTILYSYPPADSFSAQEAGLSALLKNALGRTDLAVSPVMAIKLGNQSILSFVIAVPQKKNRGRCCSMGVLHPGF